MQASTLVLVLVWKTKNASMEEETLASMDFFNFAIVHGSTEYLLPWKELFLPWEYVETSTVVVGIHQVQLRSTGSSKR